MLSEGAIVSLKGDPEPGRRYQIVGRAPERGAWWALPLDRRPVSKKLQRRSTTPNTAWLLALHVERDFSLATLPPELDLGI
ncbi:hypothetical protein GCM10025867_48730 (plasmid) [Frondihabitans sucicola]|uniref:Uncharacterized protein n=1 Tax=Frondihabitans sucicola TaxID=1268041 RepID=A0ABM8GW73_9MICO|nr:hypothetical protein [Frondihabitans sucicola]BDZ52632.1 hypothetical protein GCM10025867_48730 [Frondihabitans sucicola]